MESDRKSVWKIAIHLHTNLSDGMPTPEEMYTYISCFTDLDLIFITDHNSIRAWERIRKFQQTSLGKRLRHVHVHPGVEVTSEEGHILGLFHSESMLSWDMVRNGGIPKNMSVEETVEMIKKNNGITIAAHPRLHLRDRQLGVGKKAMDHKLFHAVEVCNGATPFTSRDNRRTKKMYKKAGRPLASVAGSDAHASFSADDFYTLCPRRSDDPWMDFKEAIFRNETSFEGSSLRFFTGFLKSLKYRRKVRKGKSLFPSEILNALPNAKKLFIYAGKRARAILNHEEP